MMRRKQFNVRLPPDVIRQINDLAETYGSQSNVIIIAINALYDEQYRTDIRIIPVTPPKINGGDAK